MSARLVVSNPQSLVDAARDFHEELGRVRGVELDRRVNDIAAAYMLRGPCKAGHPVTMENTLRIGKAGYRCRECRKAISLRYWHDKGLNKLRDRRSKARGDA